MVAQTSLLYLYMVTHVHNDCKICELNNMAYVLHFSHARDRVAGY